MTDLKSLSFEELKEVISRFNEPGFRTKQIFDWVHNKCVEDFDGMKNVPKALKEKLAEEFYLYSNEIIKIQTSKDGTQKFLFKLSDGNLVESVLMEYEHGRSVCISTQVGCAMGCVFCASGLDGLVRNLGAGEICEEVYSIIRSSKERISNIVLMGMGEPLNNYDNVVAAIRILCHENGLNLSMRHITLSTCGIVPGILRLADEGIPVTLALSLHAATQEKRQKIMPISQRFPLPEVIKACNAYREKTKRRVTYEYCLQGGVNDTDEDVNNLARLIGDGDAHINIIPVHKVEGINTRAADNPAEFKKKLEKKGINVTIRRDLGQDIDGACGQLRMKGNRP